jgi:hypothetical protein
MRIRVRIQPTKMAGSGSTRLVERVMIQYFRYPVVVSVNVPDISFWLLFSQVLSATFCRKVVAVVVHILPGHPWVINRQEKAMRKNGGVLSYNLVHF